MKITVIKIFVLKIVSVLMGVLLHFIITRRHGLEDAGNYFGAFAFYTFLFSSITTGQPRAFLNIISIHYNEWGNLPKKFVRRKMLKNYRIILSFLLLAIILIFTLYWTQKIMINAILCIFIFASLFASINHTFSEIYKALDKPYTSILLNNLIATIGAIIFALLFNSLIMVALSYVVFHGITALIVLNSFSNSDEDTNELEDRYNQIRQNMSWIVLSEQFKNFLPYMVIYYLLSPSDHALYSTAFKISSLLLLMMITVNMWLVPRIAGFLNKESYALMERYLRKVAFITALLSTFGALVILVFSTRILGVFGTDYLEAERILIYLVCANVVEIVFGPLSLILQMSQNEKTVKYGQIMNIVFIVILAKISVLKFGLNGLGLLLLLLTFIRNLFYASKVSQKLGINLFSLKRVKR